MFPNEVIAKIGILMCALVLALGCSDSTPKKGSSDTSSDADSDSDSDSDSDTDSDSDSDSDTGSGADLDADSDADSDTDTVICIDNDKDGYCIPVDCNDGDDGIHPNASDIPDNGVDEDCIGGDAKTDTDTSTGTDPCAGDTPSTDCKLEPPPPACGDGMLNQDWEKCDDGNTVPGDGCNGGCTVELYYECDIEVEPSVCTFIFECGNAKRETGEVCDDGNDVDTDGCNNTCSYRDPSYTCPDEGGECTPIAVCGNGRLEGSETCDEGSFNTDGCVDCKIQTGWTCKPNQACKPEEKCGDGVVQFSRGESCDDGDADGGDGCSEICKVEPFYTCPTPNEDCVYQVECGNKKIDSGEVCDDGNKDDGDGCSADCTYKDRNYECIEGQLCELIVTCGDGRKEGTEECDEGTNSTAGCIDCTVQTGWVCSIQGQACVREERCGDGIVQYASLGEACDDGNTSSNDGCSANCLYIEQGYVCPVPDTDCEKVVVECGNGKHEDGESCDDGNETPGDGCSSDCKTVESGYACPYPGAPCIYDCGDGIIAGPEVCDDGNETDGDGCSSDCQWEEDMRCRVIGPGQYDCVPNTCGDGPHESYYTLESCDDGNKEVGDGCSPNCKKEPSCTIGAGCTSACGDGIVFNDGDGTLEANEEECDDGNAVDGDGCDRNCQIEPGYTCTSSSELGDTMDVLIVYKDFTSGHSDFEPGATGCNAATTEMVANSLNSTTGKPTLISTATSGCATANSTTSFNQWYNHNEDVDDVVVDTLRLYGFNDNGVYKYVNRWGPNGEQWFYEDGTGGDKYECASTVTKMKCADAPALVHCSHDQNKCDLCPAATGQYEGWTCDPSICPDPGGYTNRSCLVAPRPTCEEACTGYDPATWSCQNPCGEYLNDWGSYDICATPPIGTCDDCYTEVSGYDPAAGWTCEDPCINMGNTAVCAVSPKGKVYMDGTPTFFPLDDRGTNSITARIPPMYLFKDNSWPGEEATIDKFGLTPRPTNFHHNFYFTSEVRFWFEYDSSQTQVLKFVGDDDVWVFINGYLEVDLGGIHIPVAGEIDVSTLGLTDGVVYEIVVLQAERQKEGSSYQLTLSGFNTAPSVCEPRCGDAVVVVGEQCDNGDAQNTGGYGACDSNCQLGPYCGDNTVQGTYEECDNGVNNSSYGSTENGACAPNCVLPPRCGDEEVQYAFGEQCDYGENDGQGPYNDGAYGGCETNCILAPRCGDAVVDDLYDEECDDGINDGTYGTCTEECKLAPRCGDNIVQSTYGEQCDGTDTPSGRTCNSYCRLEDLCGNGTLDDGEQCDDGVNDGGYGECQPGCVNGPVCGDATVQINWGEECDKGSANVSSTGDIYGECTDKCLRGPYCGDGTIDRDDGEECDDAVNDGTYGTCAANCQLGDRCGDGVIQDAYGEECDGDAKPPGKENFDCSTYCKLSGCGDGIVQEIFGEECDDIANDGTYGKCAPGCVKGPHCGDGIVQEDFEQCDDVENVGAYGGCAPGCVLSAHCGDGVTNSPYEECDDANEVNTDKCTNTCKKNVWVIQ